MLTKRQREVLGMMRDQEEELIYERGHGYVGLESVGRTVVMGLLRLMAMSMDSTSEVGRLERYTINETGRELLKACVKGGA